MKIIILGDVGSSKSNVEAFCNADNDLFSLDIQELCASADIVLLNLEKPLTDTISPLGKCPPDYVSPTETINGIKLLSPTAVTLANNHILDQKKQGLFSTIQTLKKNGIQYVGAGINLNEARKPLIINEKEMRIGIYACCEKEFSFATNETAGANVFDPFESLDDIAQLRSICDYLIVLYHGGMQEYPYPTPFQQKVCRKMCEKGANVVVCQHSHIVGCEEEYLGKRIIYGQGNCLLDEVDSDSWRTGIIIEISLVENNNSFYNYIPIQTCNHKTCIHKDYDGVLYNFFLRSNQINNNHFIKEQFNSFCKTKIPGYLVKLAGVNTFLQKICRRLKCTTFLNKLRYNMNNYYVILDYLYCDSHREAIETGLEQIIGENT